MGKLAATSTVKRRRESAAGREGLNDAGPLRRCLVTGAVRPKKDLLRFVIGPRGEVVPDPEGRLPGRGFWLSPGRDMVNTACAKGLFARAARKPVTVDADLGERVERVLAARCLNLIGLARRAGQAVAGFERVEAWLRTRPAGVLLAAADAAAAGRAKVRAMAPGVPVLDLFSGAELGGALGRQESVHVVLAPGRLADSLLLEAGRLAGFRDGNHVDRADP